MDATKKALGLVEEFKKFALKGSVIDLAVGVIIGAAFGKIVDSLVTLWVAGVSDLLTWALVIGQKTIPFGLFIGSVVDFLIIALVLYIFIVKFLGWIVKTKKEEGPPPMTKDQELLAEIRDLLKSREAGK